MGFRLVPKSVTLNNLERQNGPYLAWFYRLCSFRGALCKSSWQSHNYGHLRLLYLVVNVRRETARRPQIPSRFINSRLNAQSLPSYRLDIGSRIWAFDWYKNRWPWMTLNGKMVLSLCYFTEFCSFRGALRKSGWKSHNYEQFTNTMSSSKRRQRDRATPTV